MELRRLRDNEIKLLQDFLHEAIYIPRATCQRDYISA